MERSIPRVQKIHFGPFELDPRTGELTCEDRKTQVQQQPLQLLLALLERPGELVTREELTGRLWPSGTFVDYERGLNKAVNKLRELLNDSADHPHFIETLPRKGYRFIGTITDDEPPPARAEGPPPQSVKTNRKWWYAAAAAIVVITLGILAATPVIWRREARKVQKPSRLQIASLAVLPMENLSGDSEQTYFAEGMTDALITNLARMANVRVTSRTSVMRYKGTKKSIQEIGRELNVDAVVEGTVTRSGDRVRITAQLIQVATDMHLWAEGFERPTGEVLNLQNEVATDIARRVDILVRPLDQARTVNPEAYGSYLKGRYFFYQYTSEGWRKAIEYFKQAIESDAQFAPAYSGLADAYIVAGAYSAIPSRDALVNGKAAASKALQLDDTLASAHYALATAYTWYDWDWTNAEKEFRRALELDPNDSLGRNWYGGYLSLQGKHKEAVNEHELARELDPFSLIVNANLARSLYWARRYDESIAQARKTLRLDPSFGVALFWLEGALRHKNMFKQAVVLRESVTTPERAKLIEHNFQTAGFDSLMHQSAEAFKDDGALVEAARCFAQIGQKSQAITLLEQCYAQRCSSMVTLNAEPDFDVLRPDTRFQNLVAKIGLSLN